MGVPEPPRPEVQAKLPLPRGGLWPGPVQFREQHRPVGKGGRRYVAIG